MQGSGRVCIVKLYEPMSCEIVILFMFLKRLYLQFLLQCYVYLKYYLYLLTDEVPSVKGNFRS